MIGTIALLHMLGIGNQIHNQRPHVFILFKSDEIRCLVYKCMIFGLLVYQFIFLTLIPAYKRMWLNL